MLKKKNKAFFVPRKSFLEAGTIKKHCMGGWLEKSVLHIECLALGLQDGPIFRTGYEDVVLLIF